MPPGLLVAIALLADIAGAVPATAAPAADTPAATPPETAEPAAPVNRCLRLADAEPGEIVVCGKRPQGYRLDPDVVEANRGMLNGGRPRRPDRMRDTSCAVVGAAGCIGAGAGINLVGAALTAAEMAARVAKGESIGGMFITEPEPTEYQRYQAAKANREAREAQAKAIAAARAKAANGATAGTAAPEPEPGPASQ
ncbi:MAG: hypothetical protein ABI626_02210 [Sphingomicrobium sp.]